MDMLTFSEEQKAIIELARPPQSERGDDEKILKIIRVTAAAGSGKTTTLIGFIEKLITSNHERITYLTFNKAAVDDARKRLGHPNVCCSTIHKAAGDALSKVVGDEFKLSMKKRVDDSELDSFIMNKYGSEIDQFLSTVELTANMKKRKDPLLVLRKKVAFYIRKTLTRFLQSADSLEDGFDPKRNYPSCTYYPAILWHQNRTVRGLQTKHGEFYVDLAKKVYELVASGSQGFVTHDMVVKKAQLLKVDLECDALLVDESQDCTECQIQLMRNQTTFGAQVVFVGDAAQTIYSFRGAKSKYLMDIPNCIEKKLTSSYRFGPEIATIANTILFCKEFSPQTTEMKKSWDPYRVYGVAGTNGSIMGPEDRFPEGQQYTVIARTNLELFMFCLENTLGKEPEVRVAINGEGKNSGRGKWLAVLKDIEHMFSLYNGNRDALKGFNLFEGDDVTSWDKLKKCVNDRELNQYRSHIGLIEQYKNDTLEKIWSFEENVLDNNYSREEADIILTTVHAAKGMEWDNVKILDDLIELAQYKPRKGASSHGEFATPKWGDELNAWYVAVTRARKSLSLPRKFIQLITSLDILLRYGPSIDEVELSRINTIREHIVFYDTTSYDKKEKMPARSEFEMLYKTLAIFYQREINDYRWKEEMDFNVLDLSTYTSVPTPKKKRFVEVFNETSDTKRIKTVGVV